MKKALVSDAGGLIDGRLVKKLKRLSKPADVKEFVTRAMIRYDLYPESRTRPGLQTELEEQRELEDWQSRGKPLPLPHVLKQHTVLEYARQFDLRTLVETGTYFGAMVDACKEAFTCIYSIELQKNFHCGAKRKFARYPHVKLFHGDSGTILPRVLEQVSESSLFWLDAHYSGWLTAKSSVETPVLRELELIWSHPVSGHVVLIDDARLFDGTRDYPTLSRVAELAAFQGWSCEVRDDIIRLK